MANNIRAWFDKVFKKPEKKHNYNLNDYLSGRLPVYSSDFGDDIYASDVVQQAIYCIITELKKLDPVHIRKIASENDFVSVAGNIQNVLDAPNPVMTTSDFIEKTAWLLLLNYNAFIMPIWEGDTLTALYPLKPTLVEFSKDQNDKLWVAFRFSNGYEGEVAYEDIIHLRYKYSVNDYMGGNEEGEPDFKPLIETLKLNDTLLKGLAKSLNLQTTINGVVKLKTMHNYDDQVAMVKEFENKLKANESGLLPIDISAEYIPITKQVNLLDNTVLEFIDKKILRFFGVSIPIVNGDFTPEQLQAFHQKAIDPLAKSIGQAFTKGIFSKRQMQGFNNRIVFYVQEMLYMNNAEKLQYFTNGINIGAVYSNEYRTAFGFRPLKELEGVRMMSLNYINADDAKQYQVGQKEDSGGAENE